MKNRVVEVQSPGVAIHMERGSLKIKMQDHEPTYIPLDTIGVLMVGMGSSLSSNAASALLDVGAAIILTGANYMPKAHIWPIEGYHLQRTRLIAQAGLSLPFKKNLWKQIVSAKIRGQRDVVVWQGGPGALFDGLLLKVNSGDSLNIEAQAARHYWPLLFGAEFRRNSGAEDANSLLNYGYAILRASCARAVSAAGLHPSFSVFHENKENAYVLVDDLMEPFRPMVDALVYRWQQGHGTDVDSSAKKYLVSLLNLGIKGQKKTRNFSDFLYDYARDIAQSMVEGKPRINLSNSLMSDFLQANEL